MIYFKKIFSFIFLTLKQIIDLFSMLFYSRMVTYLGGMVIWCFKGFKTSFIDETNIEYEEGEPYFRKFLTSHFIGWIVYLILFFIVGYLITSF